MNGDNWVDLLLTHFATCAHGSNWHGHAVLGEPPVFYRTRGTEILKRAIDDRTAAKAKGTRFGRKPKLTAHQQAEALKRLAAGESCGSIARTMAVHHATVARLAG